MSQGSGTWLTKDSGSFGGSSYGVLPQVCQCLVHYSAGGQIDQIPTRCYDSDERLCNVARPPRFNRELFRKSSMGESAHAGCDALILAPVLSENITALQLNGHLFGRLGGMRFWLQPQTCVRKSSRNVSVRLGPLERIFSSTASRGRA